MSFVTVKKCTCIRDLLMFEFYGILYGTQNRTPVLLVTFFSLQNPVQNFLSARTFTVLTGLAVLWHDNCEKTWYRKSCN